VQATETARRILTLREGHRKLITDNLGYSAGNGHRVLEHLYERPIISVNEIRDLTGTTYPAANQLVERLVSIEVLREITGQARHRRFRYDAFVRLFDQRATTSPRAAFGSFHSRPTGRPSSMARKPKPLVVNGAIVDLDASGPCLMSRSIRCFSRRSRLSPRSRVVLPRDG
jgi:hypothetical protein